jgi:hypothetical protein
MQTASAIPSAGLVLEACERFDRENQVVEKALTELFEQYPLNRDPSHILLKVVVLNRLYSTGILAVSEMAQHIHEIGACTDLELEAGSPEIVDRIAQINIQGKKFFFYSFATKYCSWHRPDLYPIWDSRVDKYLWSIKKQGLLGSNKLVKRHDLWSYRAFRDVMIAFRDEFDLNSFSFKQIDKFLWAEGEKMLSLRGADIQTYLDKVPGSPPDPGDELPEGMKPQ